ncbi:unnamed protein product, partial [Rotaria sordida]
RTQRPYLAEPHLQSIRWPAILSTVS